MLAHVTAVGGGTIRDVLLDRHPIFWLADPAYITVITAAALLTFAYARRRPAPPPAAALLVADALGLALFSVAGAQIAERAGLPVAAGVVLGAVTGAAGGAVRDVLCAQIPIVLQRGNLYASAAIVGTAAYFALEAAGVPHSAATLIGMGVIAAVRFASIAWRLELPVYRLDDDSASSAPQSPPPPPPTRGPT